MIGPTGDDWFKVVVVTARIFGRPRSAVARTAVRIFPGLALAAALAGCATSVNSLTKAELQTINIQSVDIKYLPDAHIWWGTAEREYAAKVGTVPEVKPSTEIKTVPGDAEGDAYRKLMSTPEAQAYVRDKLAALIKDRLDREVLPKYRGGTRPVRLEIEIQGFHIPSPLQRVALGGAPALGAITVLRDATTGKELARLERAAVGYAGNGILGVAVDQAFDDLEDRVLDRYVDNILTWLTVA
jgi:hypothetical protein